MNGTTTRRRFFGGAAILAAPGAATASVAGDDVAARLAALEDEIAIRALLQDWARHISAGALAAPAPDVRRLTIDANAAIEVAANGTAKARVRCTVEAATPIDGNETVVEMARLQGDGVIRRSEQRVLAGTFVKHNGIWLLEQTELTA
jgi:hypothetical protein